MTLAEKLAKQKYKFATPALRFVNGMTYETHKALQIRHDKQSDEQRALAYMIWKMGKAFDSCKWDVCDQGVKRVRWVFEKPRAVSEFDRKRRRYVEIQPEPTEYVEIPNWDFSAGVVETTEVQQDIFA